LGAGRSRLSSEKVYYPRINDGKVLSIDALCPHFECHCGDYEIPDRVTGTWDQTNPDKHKEQATAKTRKSMESGFPLVKCQGVEPGQRQAVKPSFLIEVIAEEFVEAPFLNYPDEIKNSSPQWKRIFSDLA